MKIHAIAIRLILAGLTLTSGLAMADSSDDPVNGQAVEVPARYVFAPKGFDDNDTTVVMVDGYLPSGCYRLLRPEVNVDIATKTVRIKPMARFFDVPCVEALIPYNFEVQLGVMAVGDYTVAVEASNVTEALPVLEASNAGPDDYLYAPVDQATVTTAENGDQTAEISGRFTNSCMGWGDIRIIDNGKTVNVLPVITFDTDDRDCETGEFAYKKSVLLPRTTFTGRRLLHVRSLNGRAINYMFSTH